MKEPPSARNDSARHLVIVGNGMAAHRLLQALHDRPDRPVRITVIGEEADAAYNRILLSPWLAGEIEREALDLSAHAIATAWLDERVVGIDRQQRTLRTESGRTLDYDRLVIATGSRPTLPEIPGLELANVGSFRSLADARWLATREPGGHAVVVGGGLLGLEAAEGLRKRGLTVTVLQRSDRLMNRQLDATAAAWLRESLARRGLVIETDVNLARCEGDSAGQVRAVVLSDARRLPADCVVIAAGITPNAELARQAGLEVDRGIVVDDWLTTRDASIHALGECAEHRGMTVGLVEPIWQQVETLADVLCRRSVEPYAAAECATRLKVAGLSLYAFGPVETTLEDETLTYADPERGDYRRLLIRRGALLGAVLYGDTRDGPALFRLAQTQAPLPDCRDALLFDVDASQSSESGVLSERHPSSQPNDREEAA